MTEDAVKVELDERMAVLTIDRPDRRNALRMADKRQLTVALRSIDAPVRAIVLTGSGDRAFCAGTDIKEMAEFEPKRGHAMLETEAELFDAVLSHRLPIVAAVSGAALGAGCVLACCCDLVVADDAAVFGQPEVRNGVPAPVQAAILPRIIGLGWTRRMLYLGEQLDARQAHRLGLVARIVDEDVTGAAREYASRLGDLPPRGVALQKQIVGSWFRDPFDDAVRTSIGVAASAFETGEPQEAIARFLASK